MTPTERFKQMIAFIHDLLREHDYRRRAQHFNRTLPELTHVINIVRSRWNSADECDFWFVFGVYIPHTFSLIRPDIKEPQCPDELNMTIFGSAGWQHPPHLHQSWRLKSDDTLPEKDEQVRASITAELKDYILPFLGQFGCRKDVIQFLEWLRVHREEIHGGMHIAPTGLWLPVKLAVLYWHEGDKAACERELRSVLADEEIGKFFYDVVLSLHDRLGLS